MKKLIHSFKIIVFLCLTTQVIASQIKTKCLILGSGPAGLTAAIHTARAGIKTTLITGKTLGGKLTLAKKIENYPGFIEPIQGSQLIKKMMSQAKKLGVMIVNDHVTEVKLDSRPFSCLTENKNEYQFDALIIATGVHSNWQNIPGQKKFKGHGVSYCVTCEGFLYKNKNIAVVGKKDVAIKNALYLTNLANQITLINSENNLSTDKSIKTKLLLNNKIKILNNTTIEAILGDNKSLTVTGLKIKNTRTKQSMTLPIDGIFIAAEHTPNTSMFKNLIKLNDKGYIVTPPNSTKTNIEGVFAAGDVQHTTHKYAITASHNGFIAALEAKQYLLS
ncbi:MAG: FAD-dependent oxidoreductase [Rickettsiales bacterium]|nr:FAD-dependent oxidoreductase [Rickettsiales bacterium]